MDLLETQRLMQSTLIHRQTDPTLFPALPYPALKSTQRLEVYMRNSFYCHWRNLKTIFPVCESLVGVECFYHLVREYHELASAQKNDLLAYGEQFADFCCECPQLKSLPYFSEVAALEWGIHRSKYIPDYEPLSAAQLQQLTEAEQASCLCARPENSTLLSSPFPIWDIWQLHEQQQWEQLTQLNLSDSAQALYILSDAQRAQIYPLSSFEWTCLTYFDGVNTLEQVMEMVITPGMDYTPWIDFMAKALQHGWLLRKTHGETGC